MKPDESPAPRGSARLLRRLLAVGLTLAAIALVVFGISWLGDRAKRELGSRDRYTVRFADIECNTPPNHFNRLTPNSSRSWRRSSPPIRGLQRSKRRARPQMGKFA